MKLQIKNYWCEIAELCCKCIHSREVPAYEDRLLICGNTGKYYHDERGESGKCGKDGKNFFGMKAVFIERGK